MSASFMAKRLSQENGGEMKSKRLISVASNQNKGTGPQDVRSKLLIFVKAIKRDIKTAAGREIMGKYAVINR